MTTNYEYFYWDSCVFLAYLNEEPNRIDVLHQLWHDIKQDKNKIIVTSSVSVAEVAFVEQERTDRVLQPQVHTAIKNMWLDPTIQVISADVDIVERAAFLVREGLQRGFSRLKPLDAIHLATAYHVDNIIHPLTALHTYDNDFDGYGSWLNLSVREPSMPQPPQLPLL